MIKNHVLSQIEKEKPPLVVFGGWFIQRINAKGGL
jgi:hypothetical protein